MASVLNKEVILSQMQDSSAELKLFCESIPEEIFFRQPNIKWSIAQNVDHLSRSAAATRLAFSLPKFILRIYVGKPNRESRSFDELLIKYNQKLAAGGKSSGKFIPADSLKKKSKQEILREYSLLMEKLCSHVDKKWKDDQLDKWIAPHPLLGKITMRELCYFTIFHTRHHFETIGERFKER